MRRSARAAGRKSQGKQRRMRARAVERARITGNGGGGMDGIIGSVGFHDRQSVTEGLRLGGAAHAQRGSVPLKAQGGKSQRQSFPVGDHAANMEMRYPTVKPKSPDRSWRRPRPARGTGRLGYIKYNIFK